MSVYYVDDEDNDLVLEADDIENSENSTDLTTWFKVLDKQIDSIESQLAARRLLGTDDAEWKKSASQALSYAYMGRKRIIKRSKALGFVLMDDDATLIKHLRGLVEKKSMSLNEYRNRLFYAKRFAEVVKSEFGEAAYKRLQEQTAEVFDKENPEEIERD